MTEGRTGRCGQYHYAQLACILGVNFRMRLPKGHIEVPSKIGFSDVDSGEAFAL
jgi:hypothetical protein